jgi:hypothetical protein
MVTRTAANGSAMVDKVGPFLQCWCVHQTIRRRNSHAAWARTKGFVAGTSL